MLPLIIALVLLGSPAARSSEMTCDASSCSKEQVETVSWGQQPFSKIVASDQPYIIKDFPTLSWPCFELWNNEYLASHIERLQVKSSRKSNVFRYYGANQPLSSKVVTAKHPGLKFKHAHRQWMTGAEFIAEVVANTSGRSLYASGPIEDVFAGQHEQHIGSLSFLGGASFSQVQIDAWFSGDGVTAETHYDTMHNFYTVIQGSKTFQLSPPAAHSRMSLYPTLHAAYRQVQGSNHGSALNITLHRGDVLFLPAYWFHRVVSHGVSLSLNIWVDSPVYLLMENAFNLALPFEDSWAPAVLARAARDYMALLLVHTVSDRAKRLSFLKNVWQERYASMIDMTAWDVDKIASVLCPVVPEMTIDQRESAKIRQRADQLAEYFNKITDTDVRDIYLGNYAEQVAYRIAGTEFAVEFLYVCIARS